MIAARSSARIVRGFAWIGYMRGWSSRVCQEPTQEGGTWVS
ncbi:MAG: hypothetical protein WA137_13205 [Methanothrix sp.]